MDEDDVEDYRRRHRSTVPFRKPEVEVKPEVVFLTGEPEKGINVVPDAKTTSKVKVRVRAPFRVVVDGTPYSDGQVVNTPADDTTNLWLRAGICRARGRERKSIMAGYQSGQVSVGTTATLVATIGAAPDTDGVLVNASAAAFIGGSGVTTTTGFPVAANTPVRVPTTGAEPLSLYAMVSSGTATVSWIAPG